MHMEGLGLENVHILFVYADDLVILAENEVAIQALLKKSCDWCTLWDINVKGNKSAIIHFHYLAY